MLGLSHQLQIRQLVVPGVLVPVVDDLSRQENAAQASLHDQPMFHDVTLGIGVGVARCQPSEVPVLSAVGDETLEVRVVRAVHQL